MPRRTSPPHFPFDVFSSDNPTHWPAGKLPRLRARPIDIDAPPAPMRPGDGPRCPHEAALDRLTREQAARLTPSLAWVQEHVVSLRPAGGNFRWYEHVVERLDVAAAAGQARPAVLLVVVAADLVPRPLSGRREAVGGHVLGRAWLPPV